MLFVFVSVIMFLGACESEKSIDELAMDDENVFVENTYSLDKEEVLLEVKSFFQTNSKGMLRSGQESNLDYEVEELKSIPVQLEDKSSRGRQTYQKVPIYTVQYKNESGKPVGYSVVIGDDRVSNKIVAHNTEGKCDIFDATTADYWEDRISGYIYNEINTETSKDAVNLRSGSLPIFYYNMLNWGTSWHHHGNPYSNYTPFRGSVRASAGCTAAAMGEIMAYHQWPRRGAYKKYEQVNVLKDVVTDYSSHNWYLINKDDSYTLPSDPNARNHISNLLAEIAYKLNTNFVNQSEAYAYPSDAPAVFRQMGYNSGGVKHLSSYYDPDTFFELIRKDVVDLRRPVFMAAWTAPGQGGHAFVINGVITNGDQYRDYKTVAYIYVVNVNAGSGDSWYLSDIFKNPSSAQGPFLYQYRYNSLIVNDIYPNAANQGSTSIYRVSSTNPY